MRKKEKKSDPEALSVSSMSILLNTWIISGTVEGSEVGEEDRLFFPLLPPSVGGSGWDAGRGTDSGRERQGRAVDWKRTGQEDEIPNPGEWKWSREWSRVGGGEESARRKDRTRLRVTSVKHWLVYFTQAYSQERGGE